MKKSHMASTSCWQCIAKRTGIFYVLRSRNDTWPNKFIHRIV